jgi:hypothetical protein
MAGAAVGRVGGAAAVATRLRDVGRRDGLLPWESSAGVLIPRPDELKAKLDACTVANTHIVADFDYTLTAPRLPSGARGVSSHLLVQGHAAFGEDFRDQSYALFEKVREPLSCLIRFVPSQSLSVGDLSRETTHTHPLSFSYHRFRTAFPLPTVSATLCRFNRFASTVGLQL